jgi:2-hydroxy-3-keto-5-methylthiopentenyl-1-phosphate phosphatase
MENYIFVSDFDKTLTDKDFYQIIIDDYLKDQGMEIYHKWKRKEMYDIVFLNKIFNSIGRDEKEIMEDIKRIPFDNSSVGLIETLGDRFVILSAGSSYYINKYFDYKNNSALKKVKIISNYGYYKNKGIYLEADVNSPYYSEVYGVDKYKAALGLKKEYGKLIYAGDSEPDLKAAMIADIVFAKGKLVELLKNENKNFFEFDKYWQIEEYLMREGII